MQQDDDHDDQGHEDPEMRRVTCRVPTNTMEAQQLVETMLMLVSYLITYFSDQIRNATPNSIVTVGGVPFAYPSGIPLQTGATMAPCTPPDPPASPSPPGSRQGSRGQWSAKAQARHAAFLSRFQSRSFSSLDIHGKGSGGDGKGSDGKGGDKGSDGKGSGGKSDDKGSDGKGSDGKGSGGDGKGSDGKGCDGKGSGGDGKCSDGKGGDKGSDGKGSGGKGDDKGSDGKGGDKGSDGKDKDDSIGDSQGTKRKR